MELECIKQQMLHDVAAHLLIPPEMKLHPEQTHTTSTERLPSLSLIAQKVRVLHHIAWYRFVEDRCL